MFIKVLKGVVGDGGKTLSVDEIAEVTDATGKYLIKKDKARSATKEEIQEYKENQIKSQFSAEELKNIAEKKTKSDEDKKSGKKADPKDNPKKTSSKSSAKPKTAEAKKTEKKQAVKKQDDAGIIDTADDFVEPEEEAELNGAEKALAEAVDTK